MPRGPLALVAVLACAACGDDLGAQVAPAADGGASAADGGADAAPRDAVTVARVNAWSGGGLQLAIEWPGGAVPGAWLELDDHGGEASVSVRAAAAPVGITALLIVPAEDEGAHAARLAAAAALVDALPVGEELAVLVSGASVPALLVDLPGDRARVLAAIAAIAPAGGQVAAPMMPLLRDQVAELESRYTAPARTIVVVGEVVAETPPGLFRPVQTVSLAPGDDPAGGGAALAAELAARRASVLRVGACPDLDQAAPFTLRAGDTGTPLHAPASMAHLAGLPCDPAQAAEDDFPFADEVAFVLTPAERTIYESRVATRDETPFPGGVVLGDAAPISAELRLRGSSSLSCERKSFAVELDGERRRLGPAHASDRFLLISMCLDTRYFGQVFGNRLLADMGLFPSRFRYVRLRIDGVNRGVYLLVEQPERAYRDDSLALGSVVRRRYDIDLEPAEVKYPDDPELELLAQARFEALGDLALSEPVETLEAALDARVDLDRYLEMLALYSLLENGDYIDEVFFAESLEAGGARYRVSAWDTDDLFSLCHGGGGRGIVDPCGVAYCAEAELDQSLLRSPAIYQRYLDALARVLETQTPERLASVMDGVRADLWSAIDSAATASALTEMVSENPSAGTVAGARADIESWMTWALERIEARRAALLELLATCPDQGA